MLIQYAVPFVLTTSEGGFVHAILNHVYISRCESYREIERFSYLIILAYMILIGLWTISTWFVYGEWNIQNRNNGSTDNILQKALMIIPIGKLFKTVIYALYAGNCPWTDDLSTRYVVMALVTMSTVYQTVYIGILLLVSKGWSILRENLTRREEMIMLLLMSSVYMSYSAYYFSFGGFESLRTMTELTINFLYILLGFIVARNALRAVETLKHHLNLIPNNESPLFDSINLKLSLMKRFYYLSILIFGYEVLIHAILPIFIQTDHSSTLQIMH